MDDYAQAEAFGPEPGGQRTADATHAPADQEFPTPEAQTHWLRNLPAILSAGLICGVLTAMFAISAAALLFSTVLSTHITLAIGICLFGTIVLSAAIALFSSYPGMVSVTQEVTVVTLAVIAASIYGRMSGTHSEAEIIATVIVMIGMATTLTGVALFAMGKLRLGRLIRFIPYPVLAGFLAGMGWLIVAGALAVTLSGPLTLPDLPKLLEADAMVKWVPAVLFALFVDVATRRSGNPFVLPAAIAACLILFHTGVWWFELTVPELQHHGWLFAPPQTGNIHLPFEGNPLAQADWSMIWPELPKICVLLAISTAALLFASSGIELSVRRDIDLDRELQAAGLANLLAGAGGGAAGFQGLGLTLLAHHMGAAYRITGVLVAGVCGVILMFGATLLSVIPIPLFGGLLLWIGGGLLYQWLIAIFAKVSLSEYLIIVIIVFLMITSGLLEGIVFGVVATAALFSLEYARVRVVKYSVTGETYHGRVEQNPDDHAYLRRNGSQIHLLRLQGFIFFGSVHQVCRQARGCFAASSVAGSRFLVLDCKDVTGFDSSALQGLIKICRLVQEYEGQLILSALRPAISKRLNKLSPNATQGPPILYFDDVDTAVAWCEDRLLSAWGHRPSTSPMYRIAGQLAFGLQDADAFDRLKPYLSEITLQAQDALIRQGDPGTDIYFIESGTVKVQLESATNPPVHLRTLRPGTVVGEMSFFLQRVRTASVIAETTATVWRLSQDDIERMTRSQPALAAKLHEYFLRTMAERLDQSNLLVRSLTE
ncbi:SLC26A/SulP transporter family protein [Roseobacter sinensis]|uniref:SulP family inorganic anion transporter n=1 Tax=Roseobacter sinensis TaxID=2931391 RepID=A0ABT3BET6_9RHOB|nr:SulP family inorganic anion transporter [Roseobacter sp. WL0113]MCV3272091.1 SulP family inorganic anion transporter [Roseobacter sp. WL0113]